MKAYQSNPQLNADRARQRGTDENVPQALAGYRPQIVASLGAGLQAVRNLLPDNTVQSATLASVDDRRHGDPGPVQRLQDRQQRSRRGISGAVRARGACATSGRACCWTRVTAYMNVIANQALVEAQRANVQVLREIQATTKQASRRRRRHADGHGAGRGAVEPGIGRSQRRGSRACASARRSTPRSLANRRRS